MTRKLVVVAAHSQRPSESLARQLRRLVPQDVEVVARSPQTGFDQPPHCDAVLAATALMTSQLGPWLPVGIPVITAVRTLRRTAWEQVIALPPRTRALLVNDLPDTSVETMALLRELGASHLDLQPFFPGAEGVQVLPLAITPGEPHLVPAGVERVLDLGDRVLDPSTVMDLLSVLQRFDHTSHHRLMLYSEEVMARPGLRQTLQWFAAVKGQLEAVLDLIQEGIIAYDGAGTITLVNRRAESILERGAWQLVGRPLVQAAEELGLPRDLTTGAGDQIAAVGGRQLMVRPAPASAGAGGILSLRDVTEIQEMEKRLRSELRSRGHVARYTFGDIIGDSAAMRQTLTLARKLTAPTGSVLIYGESGTGKELFAQAIHNGSPRARYPFVAINCAAVPEGLLESELFGYDEGAFTGARRGGKEGLFEQAHRGTIFLDEIGELSAGLQARLLRVLQEREVMRVGATRVRPIDVRVICATNKNLTEYVATSRFRADLFYRLNVLTLRLPPLRQRQEDIPGLCLAFLQELGDSREIPPLLERLLLDHDWPGNVRELRNCMEYMVAVAEGPFTPEDLPDGVCTPVLARSPGWPGNREVGPVETRLFETGFPTRRDLSLWVLGWLDGNPGSGRRTLAREAQQAGYRLSEAQMRSRLESLAQAGLLELRRGRAGPVLTRAGSAYLRQATQVQ